MATQHELKTIQPYFDRVWNGDKTFEVRKNDRDFQSGDEVKLMEYNPNDNTYSGRIVYATIGYVLNGFDALKDGFVCFSIFPHEFINSKHFTH